jgi:hypothetical protein
LIRLDKAGQISYYNFFDKSNGFHSSGEPRALLIGEGLGSIGIVLDHCSMSCFHRVLFS